MTWVSGEQNYAGEKRIVRFTFKNGWAKDDLVIEQRSSIITQWVSEDELEITATQNNPAEAVVFYTTNGVALGHFWDYNTHVDIYFKTIDGKPVMEHTHHIYNVGGDSGCSS